MPDQGVQVPLLIWGEVDRAIPGAFPLASVENADDGPVYVGHFSALQFVFRGEQVFVPVFFFFLVVCLALLFPSLSMLI